MNRIWIFGFIFLIGGGLFVDQYLAWGQVVVDVVVWIVFAAFVIASSRNGPTGSRRQQGADSRRLITCLVLATAGEIVLSYFLGLYTYRGANIPLFVPPGHVMLYACGLWLAPRAPRWLWPSVLVGGVAYSVVCFAREVDQLSLVLFALWCVIGCVRPMRSLASVMVILALAMELLGTSLGNWAWSPGTLFLGGTLTLANPPFAAGVFYCGLDFLVNLLTPAPDLSLTSKDQPTFS